MRAHEAIKHSNIGADTDAFVLYGGHYQVGAKATWGGGNVVLEQLGPDGSTYLPVITAITADGVAYVFLPPGKYRWNITTATAIYLAVVRIPYE